MQLTATSCASDPLHWAGQLMRANLLQIKPQAAASSLYRVQIFDAKDSWKIPEYCGIIHLSSLSFCEELSKDTGEQSSKTELC